MKHSNESISKIMVVAAVSLALLIGILLNPALAANSFDFAGQTTGSGRIWWWFF